VEEMEWFGWIGREQGELVTLTDYSDPPTDSKINKGIKLFGVVFAAHSDSHNIENIPQVKHFSDLFLRKTLLLVPPEVCVRRCYPDKGFYKVF